MFRHALFISMLTTVAVTAAATTTPIDRWVTTGAVEMPLAVLDESDDVKPVEMALNAPPVDVTDLWPTDGSELVLAPGGRAEFDAEDDLRFSPLPSAGDDAVHLAYAATYLDNPAWQKATLEVTGRAPFRLFLDGEKALERLTAAANDTDRVTAEVILDQGHRRLMLVTAATGEDSLDVWSFTVALTRPDSARAEWLPTTTADPRHLFDFPDYWSQESVSGAEVTRDGRFLAVKITSWVAADARRTHRLEVWDLEERTPIWNHAGEKPVQSFAWDPKGERLLLKVGGHEGSDLYLWHRETGLLELIEAGLESAGSLTWSPDGTIVYYTRTKSFEAGEKPYKTMWGLEDRWSYWRDDTEIWYFVPATGTHAPLTAMTFGPDEFVVAPDGSFLLMKRSVRLEERPFIGTEIWKIATRGGEAEKILDFRSWSVGQLALSPDAGRLAFPAPMNEVLGNDSPNPDHNDNQADLWILNLETGDLENHTREFEPAIAAGSYVTGRGGVVFWHEKGKIGFTGLYDKRVKLYLYDPDRREMTEHDLATPGGSQFAASRGAGTMLVYYGDVLESPGDVFTLDWKRDKNEKLFALHPEYKSLIGASPRIEDFDYVNSDQVTIPGFLFYPRDYDPEQSYPLVVDYYGGVFGFAGGFYWSSTVYANRGYFVYVPTPRGATGWGQEFADTHPNDWGTLVSRDMNEGVRAIVEQVPGVDGARVGPVSGSYGGFMSMYLLAMPKDHPDFYPYATAISDYGISNLASYWGLGWWGYIYSDMATARQFPWNAPQYYIEHSPLFYADNVTVPLLLIHGDEDNNVPVGESDQMYTALKVLGRDVTFVRFPGEDHGIVGKRTSYLDSKRMHVEWFDKYLRDRPEAWDERMKDEFKK